MNGKLSDEAIAVLDSMEIEGKVARITEGQLGRPLYEEVNKALEAIGGKWNRKAKGHWFEDGSPQDAIDQIVTDGRYTDRKKEMQFFETPAALAERLVELAEIEPHMLVLEPSAGKNAEIVKAISAKGATVLAVEKNFGAPEWIKGKMIRWVNEDFLLFAAASNYRVDHIIMNPPFNLQQDVDHVTAAFKMLKPGGILVSVMAAGIKFRRTLKSHEFRKLAAENGREEFVDLPEGSFKDSGTMVNTVIAILRKGGPHGSEARGGTTAPTPRCRFSEELEASVVPTAKRKDPDGGSHAVRQPSLFEPPG